MNESGLRKYFENYQKSLISKLDVSRNNDHKPSAGDSSEKDWQKMLKMVMPQRYKITKNVRVIDSNNDTSDAIDIVIHDRQYCPIVFKDNSTTFIPIESVYAVFEAKQTVDSENIEYAGKKIKSVRKLEMKVVPFETVDGSFTKPPP